MADPTGADWGNLANVYGLQQSDVANLKSQGYSADQASQLLALSVGGGGTRSGGGLGGGQGSVTTPETIGGSGTSVATLLGLASALGRGGGGQAAPAQPAFPGGVDPNQPFTNLGAHVLNQKAVYPAMAGLEAQQQQGANQDPSQVGFQGGGGLTIGGISSKPLITQRSSVVPDAPIGPWSGSQQQWNEVGTQAGLSPRDIAAFQKQGLSPSDVGSRYGIQVNTQPGVSSLLNPAASVTPTAGRPVTPTPSPTAIAYQPGQAWATPPPAPGLSIGPGGGAVPVPMGGGGTFAAAHNSALADAGQALFAHFGGDPSSASPA